MMAVKRPGAYTPLSAHYADDEAIMEAGEDAELMYLRIIAYCGRTPKTEGWISDKQIRTRIGLETRPELGPEMAPETAPEKRAEKLAEVGLLRRERGGYRVVSWLRWNPSRTELDRKRTQDNSRYAPLTSENTRNATRNVTRNRTRNVPRNRVEFDSAETETETETEVKTAHPASELVIHKDEPTAQPLIAEWIDHCTEKPPRQVIGQIAKLVGDMLAEGIPHHRVREGLAEWNSKALHPAVLPSIVHSLSNRQTPVSRKQQETDAMFERAMARAKARDAAEGSA